MRPIIKGRCDQDGEVFFSSIDLVICLFGEERATTAFTCRECQSVIVGNCPRRLRQVLTPYCDIFPYQRAPELLEPHVGPPITEDDVLEFHIMLYGRRTT